MRFSTLTSAAAFFQLSIAGYTLQDDYMTDFYGAFDFFTDADPTEGFVKYVDEATARQTNLINSSSSAISWGVDTQNQTPEGRPSVRIQSKKTYDSGLIVLDVAHMPFGCGTWPAFWTTGPNWPKNGEIDIIEGVNDQTNNGMTLHTGPGCQIGEDTTQFAGSVTTGNCDVAAEDQSKNAGCSIEHPSTKSYGAGLNEGGGGVYATQWTADAISVYFFPRDSIPEDVLGDNPDPSGWGKPAAKFAGACDIESTFKQQQIVFDTTFCGQWAGSSSVWNKSSCSKKADTCEEWVKNNPEAFTEAYWTINSLKVYQDNGYAAVPQPSSVPEQSSAAYGSAPVPSETPAVPSDIPEPSEYPAAPPLITASVSGIFAPIPTSETLSSSAPVASPPADDASPSVPAETPSPIAAPTTQINAPAPAPAPTGPMSGFQWPSGGAGSGNKPKPSTTPSASLPEGTSTAIQNSSGVAAPPSTAQSVAQPSDVPAASQSYAAPGAPAPAPTASQAPAAPEVPAPAPTNVEKAPPADPAVPVVTDTVEAIRTVVQTIYHTVTAPAPAPAAPTPAPSAALPAAKGRMARHIREHRQRLTRHHARH